VQATIWLSSTAEDAQVVATLSDVDPSGASSPLTSGTLVASLRALTTAPCGPIVRDCSVVTKGTLVEPWHPHTHASQALLTPNQPTELHVEIFPTAAQIPAGHALRLTIATGDFPHELLTLSTLLNSVGVDTLYLGADHPSSLTIGAVSPAPAG
jgi:predicted acyl esterase